MRAAPAVLTIIVVGAVMAGMVLPRAWGLRVRLPGSGAVGALAAVLVFDLHSGHVGTSLGGAVLALAAGGLALLVAAFFRNV